MAAFHLISIAACAASCFVQTCEGNNVTAVLGLCLYFGLNTSIHFSVYAPNIDVDIAYIKYLCHHLHICVDVARFYILSKSCHGHAAQVQFMRWLCFRLDFLNTGKYGCSHHSWGALEMMADGTCHTPVKFRIPRLSRAKYAIQHVRNVVLRDRCLEVLGKILLVHCGACGAEL